MPEPIDLNLLRSFVAVHREGSFSAAATKLGVPRSTVSRAVASLEESLAVALFHRTTRHVSTSSAGAALFDRIAPTLGALEASLSDVPEREVVPSGTLRITAPVELGALVLADAITRFSQRYPCVRVETHLTSAVVDLVKERIDLALRISSKPLRDSTLVARRVGTIENRLYASPGYLARRQAPRTPADLEGHDLIGFCGRLALKGPSNASFAVAAKPRISGDAMWFVREATKAGAGIGPLASFMADADVAAGNLVPVLPGWIAATATVYIVRASRKHLPAAVGAFRDQLSELLRQRPLSTPGKRPW